MDNFGNDRQDVHKNLYTARMVDFLSFFRRPLIFFVVVLVVAVVVVVLVVVVVIVVVGVVVVDLISKLNIYALYTLFWHGLASAIYILSRFLSVNYILYLAYALLMVYTLYIYFACFCHNSQQECSSILGMINKTNPRYIYFLIHVSRVSVFLFVFCRTSQQQHPIMVHLGSTSPRAPSP